jgi:hypothetical protein
VTARRANARVGPGAGGDTKKQASPKTTANLGPAPTLAGENMRAFRIGLFVSDLAVLLGRLSAPEFQCYMRFRVEYVYAGACGLADDDANLVRRFSYKHWPALKSKLHILGYLHTDEGLLRDVDLDVSVARQRQTHRRQQAAAQKRWRVGEIGGAA